MSFQESFLHSSAFSLNSVGWKWPAWITQGLRRCFKKCLMFWNLQWRLAIQTEKRTPGATLHARLPVVLSVSCGYVFQSRFRAGAAPAVWDLWDSGVQAHFTWPLLLPFWGQSPLALQSHVPIPELWGVRGSLRFTGHKLSPSPMRDLVSKE